MIRYKRLQRLCLYVTGQSLLTQTAVLNLWRLRQGLLASGHGCEAEVLDLKRWPWLAERDKVVATPLLVGHLPAPSIRVLGDLSDLDAVLRALDLGPVSPIHAADVWIRSACASRDH